MYGATLLLVAIFTCGQIQGAKKGEYGYAGYFFVEKDNKGNDAWRMAILANTRGPYTTIYDAIFELDSEGSVESEGSDLLYQGGAGAFYELISTSELIGQLEYKLTRYTVPFKLFYKKNRPSYKIDDGHGGKKEVIASFTVWSSRYDVEGFLDQLDVVRIFGGKFTPKKNMEHIDQIRRILNIYGSKKLKKNREYLEGMKEEEFNREQELEAELEKQEKLEKEKQQKLELEQREQQKKEEEQLKQKKLDEEKQQKLELEKQEKLEKEKQQRLELEKQEQQKKEQEQLKQKKLDEEKQQELARQKQIEEDARLALQLQQEQEKQRLEDEKKKKLEALRLENEKNKQELERAKKEKEKDVVVLLAENLKELSEKP